MRLAILGKVILRSVISGSRTRRSGSRLVEAMAPYRAHTEEVVWLWAPLHERVSHHCGRGRKRNGLAEYSTNEPPPPCNQPLLGRRDLCEVDHGRPIT
jgi:hypothetical protein